MKQPLGRCRVIGVLLLALAAAQVVAGFTVLENQLGPVATLLFWTACLLATLGAIACAMLDALRWLGKSRQERRLLLEQTLREIDEERSRRKSQMNGARPESH